MSTGTVDHYSIFLSFHWPQLLDKFSYSISRRKECTKPFLQMSIILSAASRQYALSLAIEEGGTLFEILTYRDSNSNGRLSKSNSVLLSESESLLRDRWRLGTVVSSCGFGEQIPDTYDEGIKGEHRGISPSWVVAQWGLDVFCLSRAHRR